MAKGSLILDIRLSFKTWGRVINWIFVNRWRQKARTWTPVNTLQRSWPSYSQSFQDLTEWTSCWNTTSGNLLFECVPLVRTYPCVSSARILMKKAGNIMQTWRGGGCRKPAAKLGGLTRGPNQSLGTKTESTSSKRRGQSCQNKSSPENPSGVNHHFSYLINVPIAMYF